MSHNKPEAQQEAESKFSNFWLLHGITSQLKLLVILPSDIAMFYPRARRQAGSLGRH